MRAFHYREPGRSIPIRIISGRKPSAKTKPHDGAWIVWELLPDLPGSDVGSWRLATFPEITWGTLSKLEYLGSAPVADYDKSETEQK